MDQGAENGSLQAHTLMGIDNPPKSKCHKQQTSICGASSCRQGNLIQVT